MSAKRKRCDLCGSFMAFKSTEDAHAACRDASDSRMEEMAMAREEKALESAEFERMCKPVPDPKAAGRERYLRKARKRSATDPKRKDPVSPAARRRKMETKRTRREVKKRRRALTDPALTHPFRVEVKRVGPGQEDTPILGREMRAHTCHQAAQAAADELAKNAPGLWLKGVPVQFRVTREGLGLVLEGVFEAPPVAEEPAPEPSRLILPPGMKSSEMPSQGVLVSREVQEELNAEAEAKARAKYDRERKLFYFRQAAGVTDPALRGASRKLLQKTRKPPKDALIRAMEKKPDPKEEPVECEECGGPCMKREDYRDKGGKK